MSECKLCGGDIYKERTIESDVGYHISCTNVMELHDKIKTLEATNGTLRLELAGLKFDNEMLRVEIRENDNE